MIIQRLLFQTIKPYFDSKEAIIITGMRRVGKTTLCQSIYEAIPSRNKIFLDLENPLHQKYFEEENFEQIKFSFETLGIDFHQKPYIFLDEIQLAKTIPQVVKYFIDHYDVKFFLTGSASFYLKNLFSESLAGRKYVFELFPLSFKEFLVLKEARLQIPPEHAQFNRPIFETLLPYYTEYMEFGGFPQVVLKSSIQEKKRSLQEIFSSYFQLEVERLSDFKKIHKLRDLILLLLERVGSQLDIQKLSDELSLSRPTVSDYLAFLEGTYFIKLIKPFSRSRDVEIKKMPKVYVCDSGLANAIAGISSGSLFEQNVFQSLRLRGELNYYQRKSGVEIDFVLDKKYAYEVKTTAHETDRQRLIRLSRELDLVSYQLVSFNYSDMDNIIYGFEI